MTQPDDDGRDWTPTPVPMRFRDDAIDDTGTRGTRHVWSTASADDRDELSWEDYA